MTERALLPKIRQYSELPSTNHKAKELAIPGSEGTIVVANSQTAGRGQGKNSWYSPIGGLFLSAILKANPLRPTDHSLIAGIAMAQSVQNVLPKSLEVSVKWPNDCLINWKKVGGILCEYLGPERDDLCIIGMGINVNIPSSDLRRFEDNPFSATSCLAETSGGALDMLNMTNVLVKKLFTLHELYVADGFKAIHFLWSQNCKLIGKRIRLTHPTILGESTEEAEVEGICEGIDSHGALVLSHSKGGSSHYIGGKITCFWP